MSSLPEKINWIFKSIIKPGKKYRPDMNYVIYKDPAGKAVTISDYLIDCVVFGANQFSKGMIRSVVDSDDRIDVTKDSITRLFGTKPNPAQTTTDFLKLCWNTYQIKGDLFVYPSYDLIETASGNVIKKIKGFYVIPYADFSIDMIKNTADFTIVSYVSGEQQKIRLPYSDVAHLKNRRAGLNPLCGGDTYGRMDYTGMSPVIEALSEMISGVGKIIKGSLGIRGLFTADSQSNEDTLDEIRKTFEKRIVQSEYGFLYNDIGGSFTPLNSALPEIDPKIMEYLESVCARRFGVSIAMLRGDYSYEQYAAFYQAALEGFIIEFEQALSAVCFTQRELSVGHKVRYYADLVRHYSIKDKIKMGELGTNTGVFTETEIRDMFGYLPKDPDADSIMSLNFIKKKDISEYQTGHEEAPVPEENNQEKEKEEDGEDDDRNDEQK